MPYLLALVFLLLRFRRRTLFFLHLALIFDYWGIGSVAAQLSVINYTVAHLGMVVENVSVDSRKEVELCGASPHIQVCAS